MISGLFEKLLPTNYSLTLFEKQDLALNNL